MSFKMIFGERKVNGKVDVTYHVPNSGVFTKEIDEDYERMLRRAIEFGKEEAKREFRDWLKI
jgi:hypothetical protein